MLVLTACLYVLAFAEHSGSTTAHRLSKRFIPFIYPKNGIIQFALGLGLPANVRGRNIATNSGILINIMLPTNVSQLRPPQRSLRSSPGHRGILQEVTGMLGIKEENRDACLARSLCLLHYSQHQQSLARDIFEAIVEGIFDEDKLFNMLRKKRNTPLSEEECFKYYNKCDSIFLNYLDEIFH